MTGLGYDKNKTGDQDSLDVLFSDEFEGKLTYLTEMRDTVGLSAHPAWAYDPETLTAGAVRRGAGRGRQGGQDRHRPPGRPATRTSRTWPAAASSWRWPGPATC